MLRILATALLLLCSTQAFGLEKVNNQLKAHAEACPKAAASNVKSLALYLRTPAKNQSQIVEVFCYWIAANIAYDTQSYISGKDPQTETILQTRKGICFNYAELLEQLCAAAGIECHVVHGYAKGYSYTPKSVFREIDHSWNVVKADNQYVLVDATWASGYATGSGTAMKFVRKLDISEIIADPDVFILTHLPADPRWQLRTLPIAMKSYETCDSLRDMVKKTLPYYNYTDSIRTYVAADSITRSVIADESAYRFNPIRANLSALADGIFNQAWYYGNFPDDKTKQERSLKAYKRAIAYYEQLNSDYGRESIAQCRQGIEYASYRIKELGT